MIKSKLIKVNIYYLKILNKFKTYEKIIYNIYK